MAWVQIALAVLSAVSAMKAGQQSASQAKYQQALALQQAERERELGQMAADDRRRQGSRLAATQRARLAASGVDMNTGTALLLQEDLAAETEYQALVAEAGGDTSAAAFEAEGKLFGAKAGAARTQSYFKAGTTLLSAGSKAFGDRQKRIEANKYTFNDF